MIDMQDNTLSSSATTNENKILGSGSYGTVYRTGPQTVKKISNMIDHENYNLESPVIRELCFLSTFNHPHIRGMSSCSISNLKVTIHMPDGGIPLNEWVKSTQLDERLPHIPKIVAQICSVLSFLQSMNMSHGDLKPHNILIDSSHNIKVIDWGTCCYLPHAQHVNGCTEQFAAPELLNKPSRNGPEADIFSLGMVIRFLVYGILDTVRWIKWQCHQLKYVPILERYHNQSCFSFIRKCQSFLQADYRLRPTASKICEWKELESYKLKNQPIFNQTSEQMDKVIWKADSPFSYVRREKLIKRMCYIVNRFQCYESLVGSIQLLEEYFISKESTLDIEKLDLYGAACIMITTSILSICLHLQDLLNLFDPAISPTDFYVIMIDILQHFSYRVYRQSFTDTIHHISGKHIQTVLLQPNIMSLNHSQRLECYQSLIKAEIRNVLNDEISEKDEKIIKA